MAVIYKKRATTTTKSSNHVNNNNKKPKQIWVVKKYPEQDLPPFDYEQQQDDELANQQIQEFADRLKFAQGLPPHQKPSRESWKSDSDSRKKFRAIQKYAFEDFDNAATDHEIEQEVMAERILRAMGFASFTYSTAANVLIDIGYYSSHLNLDLSRFRFYPYNDDDEQISTEVNRLLNSHDNKEKDMQRKDLTAMNAYAIDPEGAEELDDALSVTRLIDGRIQVWIHIADPSNLVKLNSLMDMHARDRGTTVFLPTGSYPMFPQKLAMEGMSLRHGECCNALSVSVVLNIDGSIGQYSVDVSTIKPTMLTYTDATELLAMGSVEEQTMDLQLLLEAADARFNWRMKHGAENRKVMYDARVKVTTCADESEPSIKIYNEDQEKTQSAHRLVDEMMFLCGEVIASFGSRNNIPLPYRVSGRFSYCAEPHNSLGLIHGYVQVTSPIRRYMDLVAHYQVKSFLAGREPLMACDLQRIGGDANKRMADARCLQSKTTRYWMTEYLRRRQAEGEIFAAKVIRFIHGSESTARILLKDLGFMHVADLPEGVEEGDEIQVEVENADPGDQLLTFKVVHNSRNQAL